MARRSKVQPSRSRQRLQAKVAEERTSEEDFALFKKGWRRILIGIFGWSQSDYNEFIHYHTEMFKRHGDLFLRDGPFEYISGVLISKRIDRLLGSNGSVVKHKVQSILKRAIVGGGLEMKIALDDYDLEAGKQRYFRWEKRMHRFLTIRGKASSPRNQNCRQDARKPRQSRSK